MRYQTGDWLEVVYGAGLDASPAAEDGEGADLRIHAAPGPGRLPAGEVRRIRVTVTPPRPGLEWRLYLRDLSVNSFGAAASRAWWRVYPGTWQPLSGPRECLAEGRGRVRVDISVRAEPGEPAPRLRFVAEPV